MKRSRGAYLDRREYFGHQYLDGKNLPHGVGGVARIESRSVEAANVGTAARSDETH
jgi:hypothetical protein